MVSVRPLCCGCTREVAKHERSVRDDIRMRSNFSSASIDLFHNGDQIQYSFVLMLIGPTRLIAMGKILKNISTKVRPVGLTNINTKE